MDAIYLLIPIALLLVIVGVAIFIWAVKNDQFDDLEGPAHSILFDDVPKASHKAPEKPSKNATLQTGETPDCKSTSETNPTHREL